MKRSLLEIARCPGCGGRLEVIQGGAETDIIADAALYCAACKRQYKVEQGMPFLHLQDDSWTSKAREAQGWVDYHKMKGIYDQTGVEIDFLLPYFGQEPWLEVARSFDIALEIADLKGDEWVLDLGAGRGWAAKHFALKGCNVVALDVVPDDQVGLGRSRALMQRAGVHYELIIGDSENLPFADDIFDIVFCCGVLHHASDLEILARSIRRILKPRGRLLAIQEPCIPKFQSEAEALRAAAEELACGINERRWNIDEHYRALQAAGFGETEIFPRNAYHLPVDGLRSWAAELGVVNDYAASPTIGRRIRDARRWLWRTSTRYSAPMPLAIPEPRSQRESLIQKILLECGGSIVICARK